jgi:hypothetical protein
MCNARMLLLSSALDQQGSSCTQPGLATTQELVASNLYGCTMLLGELALSSLVNLDAVCDNTLTTTAAAAAAGGGSYTSATTDASSIPDPLIAAALSCGTPAAPLSFLHSQDVFAAHAADFIATMEGSARLTLRVAARQSTHGGFKPSQPLSPSMDQCQHQAAVAVLLARQAGPGSPGLRHCYSYLGTLLKLGASQMQLSNAAAGVLMWCAAAEGAAALLTGSAQQAVAEQQQH